MADIEKKRRYVYFLYSQSQQKMCEEIERSVGRYYEPGQVVANGKMKPYTEISSTSFNNKYADAKVVIEGYIDEINYKAPSRKWRK